MLGQLEKAYNLSRKTGDRLIVFDANYPDRTYVVMPVDDYERMVTRYSDVRGLTENDLLDRINRDIAIWKSEQISEENDDNNYMNRIYGERQKSQNPRYQSGVRNGFTSLRDFFEEQDLEADRYAPERTEPKPKRNNWQIPAERKQAAEEIIEEDRQYLEEVKF